MLLSDAIVIVDDVDLSDHVTAVSYDTERELIEVTTVNDANRVWSPGLTEATVAIRLLQDFAEVDQTLTALAGGSNPCRILIRPVNAVASATNPSLLLEDALLFDYSPLNGTVGDVTVVEATFIGTLARETAPGFGYGLGFYGEGSYGG